MLQFTKLPWGKIGLFAGGVLFGTAGIKILSSRDAKKCYTTATAAVLRAKDNVMETVTAVRENCGDILTDAREINAARAAQEEDAFIADTWQEDAETEIPAGDAETSSAE